MLRRLRALLVRPRSRRLRVVGTTHQSCQQTCGISSSRGRLVDTRRKLCLGGTRLLLVMFGLVCLMLVRLVRLVGLVVVLRR